MALGEWNIFTFKSKGTQEKEAREYEKWAFPYGKEQQEKLQNLLLEAFPKESVPTTLIPYLTCKELFTNKCKSPADYDAAIVHVLKLRKYKRLIRESQMPVFLAFVLADYGVDADIEYPQLSQIMQKADELREIAAKLKAERK